MLYLASVGVFAGLLVVLAVGLLMAERLLVNYGVCTVHVNRDERVLEVEGGRTLLETFYDNEIFIPSACGGRGTCTYCKVTVLNGGGPVLSTETALLTRPEVRAGVRLACQVKVKQDLDVVVPEEYLNVQAFVATVSSTRDLTHDTKEIRLALVEPDRIEFTPGQYVQVRVPTREGDVFRAYSISSGTDVQNEVELIVRLVPGGLGSTYLHSVAPGDEVGFVGPFGEFELSDDPGVEVVCVGGGCGLAPIKSIVETLCTRWPDRPCRLFFGCRTPRDVFHLDHFQTLERRHPNLHVVYALSDPLPDGETWDGERGFVHLSVDRHLTPGTGRQAFLCGPEPMIEAVMRVLEDKGLRDADIFYDKF